MMDCYGAPIVEGVVLQYTVLAGYGFFVVDKVNTETNSVTLTLIACNDREVPGGDPRNTATITWGNQHCIVLGATKEQLLYWLKSKQCPSTVTKERMH